ncbi:hypothetical protein F5884DRAFT_431493 [Xylogone sp. PMI_703]|nr:hypothetical protein F5884DRAFT_431493 [Xylogone sp. PMI_703]
MSISTAVQNLLTFVNNISSESSDDGVEETPYNASYFNVTSRESAMAENTSVSISWHDPHPIFVIILVGPDEVPFGIQKDLLCAKSPYYRNEFSKPGQDEKVELIVKLPDFDVDTFGCFQNYLYTGEVYDRAGGREIPDYPLLMNVWKLATTLQMPDLHSAALSIMNERRIKTSMIPGTPLLIQAWKDTEEGSGLRMMLIGWAAEHMRSAPDIRNEFARSLPHEILSELVVVMSDLPATPAVTPHAVKHSSAPDSEDADIEPNSTMTVSKKRNRASSGNGIEVDTDLPNEVKQPAKRTSSSSHTRTTETAIRQKEKRRSATNGNWSAVEKAITYTNDQELDFCKDLIHRMLSGPGYWTRLVGPFKNPVDPVLDNVPNYFTVVKRPMDLRTIKSKMDKGEYATAADFEKDIRLIFQNCYEYWTREDSIFKLCEQFEAYFNQKWAVRHKAIANQIKNEDS